MAPEPKDKQTTRYVTTNVERVTPVIEHPIPANAGEVIGRMLDQTRALALEPCEFEGEPCYGCATCFARETVRMLSVAGPASP